MWWQRFTKYKIMKILLIVFPIQLLEIPVWPHALPFNTVWKWKYPDGCLHFNRQQMFVCRLLYFKKGGTHSITPLASVIRKMPVQTVQRCARIYKCWRILHHIPYSTPLFRLMCVNLRFENKTCQHAVRLRKQKTVNTCRYKAFINYRWQKI